MKRILITLAIVIGSCAIGIAQKGLYVHSIFSGKYNNKENAVVTILKGNNPELKKYRLTYFHCILVVDSKKDVSSFEYAVLADSEKAVKTEIVKQKGKLLAGYFQLPPKDDDSKKQNRFILFRKQSDTSAAIIYLEGSTDLKSLIQLFVMKK